MGFLSGALIVGYILGGDLTGISVLVSSTEICSPLMIYNTFFPVREPGETLVGRYTRYGDDALHSRFNNGMQRTTLHTAVDAKCWVGFPE